MFVFFLYGKSQRFLVLAAIPKNLPLPLIRGLLLTLIEGWESILRKNGQIMSLEALLSKKKATILKRWFQSVLEVYPADTQNFLRKQKNPFSNPVGQTIMRGIEGLFDQLVHDNDPDGVRAFLENIMKIRAVQDLTPSQAIAFIPVLKKSVREELGGAIRKERMIDEWLLFESKVDGMVLLAFDIYMKCRERIYEIKANELRRRTTRLLKKTKFFDELTYDAKPEDEQTKNSS
jgi:hypothetical protein